jgi:hypothetical protein
MQIFPFKNNLFIRFITNFLIVLVVFCALQICIKKHGHWSSSRWTMWACETWNLARTTFLPLGVQTATLLPQKSPWSAQYEILFSRTTPLVVPYLSIITYLNHLLWMLGTKFYLALIRKQEVFICTKLPYLFTTVYVNIRPPLFIIFSKPEQTSIVVSLRSCFLFSNSNTTKSLNLRKTPMIRPHATWFNLTLQINYITHMALFLF